MLSAGQFVVRSAGRSRGTSMQFASHRVERQRYNFRVTAGHDNCTELAPDDRQWHHATFHSRFDKLGPRLQIRGTFTAVAQSGNQKPARAEAQVYWDVNACAAAGSFAGAR
jgi:hypothetical protein